MKIVNFDRQVASHRGQSFWDDTKWIVSWAYFTAGYEVWCESSVGYALYNSEEEAIAEATRRYVAYRMTK